ncbi:MAG: hypothetical protein SGARI_007994 [Bacillariaceae sp.]
MRGEGAFLIAYDLKDPLVGAVQIISAVRFYRPMQSNTGDLVTNSLLRNAPGLARYSNVDPTWANTNVSNVSELSYVACDTNKPGGLMAGIREKDDDHQTTDQGERKKIRKRAPKEKNPCWNEPVHAYVASELQKASEKFYNRCLEETKVPDEKSN